MGAKITVNLYNAVGDIDSVEHLMQISGLQIVYFRKVLVEFEIVYN